MKTMEFESGLEPKKKLMVVLFWTNRKAARTEGCAPFKIMKITTQDKTYTPEGRKLLKLSDEILDELEKEIEADNPLYMELNIGNEIIEATLEGNTFTVSTQVSDEIEEEIIQKLTMELQKKYPNICESFTPRVTPLE
ncbi:MAG: hypothetical protein LUQ24_05520 [Methanobacterium sp.]|jgi:hypothetical protein|nr:hypothetical protein [Methanobacterium sp.]